MGLRCRVAQHRSPLWSRKIDIDWLKYQAEVMVSTTIAAPPLCMPLVCHTSQPSHTEPAIVRLTMNHSESAVFLRSFGDPVCQLGARF
jgi:hypothetical protein